MDQATRDALIARYEAGYDRVKEALTGISEAELDARPAPGEWTAREIVHHLADSEMTSAIRLRRLIAERDPTIYGYDQDEWVRRLYPQRPIEPSLHAFGAARQATAPVLRLLTEAEWQRAGTHDESGRYGVEDWLRIYAAHAHDHADQIERARASAGTTTP
jgi:hypothetical protein